MPRKPPPPDPRALKRDERRLGTLASTPKPKPSQPPAKKGQK